MARTLGALLTALLACQATGHTQTPLKARYAVAAVPLVASASATAISIGTALPGAKLQLGKCANGWCEVTGLFVAERYLSDRPSAASALSAVGTPTTTTPAGPGYVNSVGEQKPSPVKTNGGAPAGATARCRDGSYSFSSSRSGTCSRHGGVAEWL